MPFTPKFVDMVRNATTVTGSGPVTLGSAVSGYTGFADAVAPGEQFYYCIQGVDKPAEREVGRGTMQAGGTVARTPIAGSPTNFTPGTKTISLVAAAEWFAKLDLLGGSTKLSSSALRSDIAALATAAGAATLLLEAGREGLFSFDAANRSAEVAADPAQAIYVPPASDTSGASGAWVRKYSGPRNARWYGAAGDGITDDATALQRWLDAGGALLLPAGEYYASLRLIVRKLVCIEGEAYGFDARSVDGGATLGYDNQPGSRIRFAAGVGGLDIQPQTPVTDVTAAVALGASRNVQEGAAFSRISDLALVGAGTGAVATGLYSRALVYLDNVHVYRFRGKGFDLSGSDDFSDGNSEYGGPSQSCLTRCRAVNNAGHGFHLRGRNTNVIKIDTCYAQLNGGWGFLDESLLGSGYVNCLAATNTLGSFKCIGTVCDSAYENCYVEPDANWATDISYRCAVIGGYLAAAVTQANIGTNGTPVVASSNGVSTSQVRMLDLLPNFGGIANKGLIFRGADRGLTLQGAPGAGGASDISVVNKNDSVVMSVVTGTTTARFYGSVMVDSNTILMNGAAAFPGVIATQAMFLSHAANGAMLAGWGSAYDVSLANKAGQLALSIPNATQDVRMFGLATTSGNGIGYAPGAGGAVTQASAKSSGVTLNKPAGQITLHGAALGAGAKVSFVVSNSLVAGTDTIIASIASGGTANAYRAHISAVAAGSFTITVENISAGSLSEAPLINFALVKAVAA